MDDHSGPKSVSQPVSIVRKGQSPRSRSDARRNRLRVIDIAQQLVAARDLASVTMEEIAAAAGVGKGTVYRCFGDKGGLAMALLDARERVLQEQVLTGPPPVGPGAPAAERLVGFTGAYLEFLEDAVDLLVVADNSPVGARYDTGAYAFWHAHIASLLRDLRSSAGDSELVAHCLLAPLAADLYRHLRPGPRDGGRRWAQAVEHWVRMYVEASEYG